MEGKAGKDARRPKGHETHIEIRERDRKIQSTLETSIDSIQNPGKEGTSQQDVELDLDIETRHGQPRTPG